MSPLALMPHSPHHLTGGLRVQGTGPSRPRVFAFDHCFDHSGATPAAPSTLGTSTAPASEYHSATSFGFGGSTGRGGAGRAADDAAGVPRPALQKEIFDTIGTPVLDSAFEGYNCSVFAYGQTGAGYVPSIFCSASLGPASGLCLVLPPPLSLATLVLPDVSPLPCVTLL